MVNMEARINALNPSIDLVNEDIKEQIDIVYLEEIADLLVACVVHCVVPVSLHPGSIDPWAFFHGIRERLPKLDSE